MLLSHKAINLVRSYVKRGLSHSLSSLSKSKKMIKKSSKRRWSHNCSKTLLQQLARLTSLSYLMIFLVGLGIIAIADSNSDKEFPRRRVTHRYVQRLLAPQKMMQQICRMNSSRMSNRDLRSMEEGTLGQFTQDDHLALIRMTKNLKKNSSLIVTISSFNRRIIKCIVAIKLTVDHLSVTQKRQ